MVGKSAVTVQARELIIQKLKSAANIHKVSIVLAVESGSRAWGFPSRDSDYDVRFIYVRSKDDYLSVQDFRDVIETDLAIEPTLGVPLDLNGWDIRKALQLAVKSNAVLLEWLQSPVTYIADSNVVGELFNLAVELADSEFIKNHYYKIACNAWNQIKIEKEKVKLKLYCYALRPVLALQWCYKFGNVPPMDIASLLKKLVLDDNLLRIIAQIITIKATAQEGGIIQRNQDLDSFIEGTLNHPVENIKKVMVKDFTRADAFFRKMVIAQ